MSQILVSVCSASRHTISGHCCHLARLLHLFCALVSNWPSCAPTSKLVWEPFLAPPHLYCTESIIYRVHSLQRSYLYHTPTELVSSHSVFVLCHPLVDLLEEPGFHRCRFMGKLLGTRCEFAQLASYTALSLAQSGSEVLMADPKACHGEWGVGPAAAWGVRPAPRPAPSLAGGTVGV